MVSIPARYWTPIGLPLPGFKLRRIVFSSFSRSSRTPQSHEKHDRFGQELLEVINIYLNDCTLFFLTEKIILFSAIGPPLPNDPVCTHYAVDEGGLCSDIYYICVIHLGAGPKSRPLPLILFYYFQS